MTDNKTVPQRVRVDGGREPATDLLRRERQRCKTQPRDVQPVVDWKRCEGKGECVNVCPYSVFEVHVIDDAAFAALPVLARVKLWVHGKRVAYTPRLEACRACGLCVAACPEKAISLAKVENCE